MAFVMIEFKQGTSRFQEDAFLDVALGEERLELIEAQKYLGVLLKPPLQPLRAPDAVTYGEAENHLPEKFHGRLDAPRFAVIPAFPEDQREKARLRL